jgi:hypothetical protein
LTLFDQGLRSHADPEVIAVCQREGLAPLSLDLDFSNILAFPPERFALGPGTQQVTIPVQIAWRGIFVARDKHVRLT